MKTCSTVEIIYLGSVCHATWSAIDTGTIINAIGDGLPAQVGVSITRLPVQC